MKAEFQEKFKIIPEFLELKLSSRFQGEKENIDAYINDIKGIAYHLNPNMHEQDLIRHILRGLRPTDRKTIAFADTALKKLERNLKQLEYVSSLDQISADQDFKNKIQELENKLNKMTTTDKEEPDKNMKEEKTNTDLLSKIQETLQQQQTAVLAIQKLVSTNPFSTNIQQNKLDNSTIRNTNPFIEPENTITDAQMVNYTGQNQVNNKNNNGNSNRNSNNQPRYFNSNNFQTGQRRGNFNNRNNGSRFGQRNFSNPNRQFFPGNNWQNRNPNFGNYLYHMRNIFQPNWIPSQIQYTHQIQLFR